MGSQRSRLGWVNHVILGALSIFAATVAETDRANAVSGAIPKAISLPDLVTTPPINLGFTSFFDGFGKFTPGWVFIDYGHWQHLTSISTSKGTEVPGLNNPDIEALVNIFQFVWVSPLHVPGGAVGWDVLLPVVDLSSSFTQPGGNLRANGFATGDLNWGPFYQASPIKLFGHLFSWRTEFDVISPSGGFDPTKDINQSSGFWSINPYVAFTYLPTDKWEVTARLWYLYNFTTNKLSNPPQIPSEPIETGQAGDAAWINFASSYAISKPFSIGINGYYFQQLSDDKVNGGNLPHTIKNELYLGPGFHWEITKANILNTNLYLPVTTHGVANGPQLNFQFVHVF